MNKNQNRMILPEKKIIESQYYKCEKITEKIKAFLTSYNLRPIIISSSCCFPEKELFFISKKFSKLPGITSLKTNVCEANLLIVSGPVNEKFSKLLEKILNSSEKPKYIIAIGDCATDLTQILPVDIHLPGCHPSEDDLLNALKKIQKRIRSGSIKKRTDAFNLFLDSKKEIPSFFKFGYTVSPKIQNDIIEKIKIKTGYSHRGLENLILGKTIPEVFTLLDTIDNHSRVLLKISFSKLIQNNINTSLSLDYEFLNILFLELLRISSHLENFAKISKILGFTSLFKLILNNLELSENIFKVAFKKRNSPYEDIISEDLQTFLDKLSSISSKINSKILSNYFITKKLKNLGTITKTQAINYCLSGPNIKATGLNIDERKESDIYNEFRFKPVLGKSGTSFDRFKVRFDEILQSQHIIYQVLNKINKFVSPKESLNVYLNTKIEYINDFVATQSPGGKFGFFITITNNKITKFKIVESSSSAANMLNDFFINIPPKHLDLFLLSFDINASIMDK